MSCARKRAVGCCIQTSMTMGTSVARFSLPQSHAAAHGATPVGRGHALAGTRGVSRTLSRLRPRKFGLVGHAGVPVTWIRSTPATSSRSTACASMRASCAPRHRWIPDPNARWPVGLRSARKVSGSSYSRGSRLAAPHSNGSRERARIVAVADRVIGAGGAEEALNRRSVAELLFYRGGDQLRPIVQQRKLIRALGEREEESAQQICGGLVAGEQQQHCEEEQFFVAHLAILGMFDKPAQQGVGAEHVARAQLIGEVGVEMPKAAQCGNELHQAAPRDVNVCDVDGVVGPMAERSS